MKGLGAIDFSEQKRRESQQKYYLYVLGFYLSHLFSPNHSKKARNSVIFVGSLVRRRQDLLGT